MLKEIKLNEQYEVIDKKIYASVKEINSKRELNGCEVRIDLVQEIDLLKSIKEMLEKELAETTQKITEFTRLDSQLASLGYCKIDKPIYKRIDGIVIKDSKGNAVIDKYTQEMNCPNKAKAV